MTIKKAIELLQNILNNHGDIECQFDCPYCGRPTIVGVVTTGPITARLQSK